ncbi:hypothetical protein H480_19780 [Amycolatopsis vancoresmycina DSM 44592]|uniref:Uncharacterized protein n=1 Tax=Amycolatopsis vancoresmycina DSM 44592 TaxID=1292037 RepID=R1I2M1_9PSEU|nr:hypothetical protein H480_19780 [Amycolatopsis vancoresmycina DSM 44592]
MVQAQSVHGDLHVYAAQPGPVPAVPRQLPASPAVFTGRMSELAALDHALIATTPGGRESAAVLISAIGGVGGIGKTWLALAWAHRNLHRFPHGQLFVDLQGFSPSGRPVEAADAVRGFLHSLGADPDGLPSGLDALSALYRSSVAGRRMLIVLDNAATAEQVVPLLPGSPTCTVLVTGRTTLPTLIDRYGAHHLQLDVLTHDEARELLTTRLDQRAEADPEATGELIGLCGRHPLALAIIARQAITRPRVPLAELAVELGDLALEVLDHDTDPAGSLPAVLSWSLRHFTGRQRRAFALLGIAPGPDIGLPAAYRLLGLSPADARRVLRVLEDSSLLDRRPDGRYSMHDLVRAYAASIAHHSLPEPVRRAASDRIVDFYLHTAHTAERLLNPHREPIRPVPGSRSRPPTGHADALDWLEVHHPHLLAAQRTAASLGRHEAVWRLAWALSTFHQRREHHHDALAVWQGAAEAASHLPDPAAGTIARERLGRAHAELGRHEEAVRLLHQALDLAGRHDDRTQQAHAHRVLTRVWEIRNDHQRALVHAREALRLFRDLAEPAWVANALNSVGWFSAHLGDHGTARDHCRQALEVYRHHSSASGVADTLHSLGYIDFLSGNHHDAISHYRQALAVYRDLGYSIPAAGTLHDLGHSHLGLGQRDETRAVWNEALELYRQQGHRTAADRVRRQLDKLLSAGHDATI